VHKKYEIVKHIDEAQAAHRFIDSVRSAHVDTIIGYYSSKGSEIGMPCPFYVYWQCKEGAYITQFDRYTDYNILSGSYNPAGLLNPTFIGNLRSEKLKETKFFIDDDSYEYVTIILNNDSTSFSMSSVAKAFNEFSNQAVYIDKFRSYLLGINQWEWKGLNYKYGQRDTKRD
jgi:hypothetical protein